MTALVVASYNVLAPAYARTALFPRSAPGHLDPRFRIPALCRRVAALGADVCCLQEVEPPVFEALGAALRPMGYAGRLAMKSAPRPDGCATFVREHLVPVAVERLVYDEGLGASPSGHIAQLVVLEAGGRRIGVANTHLRWDPPDTPPERQHGVLQLRQLLAVLRTRWPAGQPWVLAGDFNAEPSSPALQLLRGAGYRFVHQDEPAAATCNANGRARLIDYVCYPDGLRAAAMPLPAVADDTPLPGAAEPSDHVPVLARLEWPAGGRATAP